MAKRRGRPNLARRARKTLGMTQAEFSELIGVHVISVTRWETGAVDPQPLAKSLLRLIEHYGEDVVAVLR